MKIKSILVAAALCTSAVAFAGEMKMEAPMMDSMMSTQAPKVTYDTDLDPDPAVSMDEQQMVDKHKAMGHDMMGKEMAPAMDHKMMEKPMMKPKM